ncbi:MAG: hypothetical protein AAF264_13365 [Pseudomonadota bacterium]
MTRVDLCIDTTHRFFAIFEGLGFPPGFTDQVDLGLRTQFVEQFTFAFENADGEIIGGMGIRYDWERHEKLCLSFGDDIDMSDLGEGETFETIARALSALERYAEAINRAQKIRKVTSWIQYSQKAIAQYGIERVREVLNLKAPDDPAAVQTAWAKLQDARATARLASATPDDLGETDLFAFMTR